MIPFDLTRAKQGVPIRTREGVTAKLLAHLDGGQPAPLVVEIDGHQVENYYLNGKHETVHDSPLDLFMQY